MVDACATQLLESLVLVVILMTSISIFWKVGCSWQLNNVTISGQWMCSWGFPGFPMQDVMSLKKPINKQLLWTHSHPNNYWIFIELGQFVVHSCHSLCCATCALFKFHLIPSSVVMHACWKNTGELIEQQHNPRLFSKHFSPSTVLLLQRCKRHCQPHHLQLRKVSKSICFKCAKNHQECQWCGNSLQKLKTRWTHHTASEAELSRPQDKEEWVLTRHSCKSNSILTCQMNIKRCLDLMQFGMQSTLLTFVIKCLWMWWQKKLRCKMVLMIGGVGLKHKESLPAEDHAVEK